VSPTHKQILIAMLLLVFALWGALALGVPPLAGLTAGVLLALLLSRAAAQRVLQPLGELRERIGALAEGRFSHALPAGRASRLGDIGEALDRLGSELDDRIATATDEAERLQAVLASMVDGVLVVDAAGQIVIANPRLRELFAVWGPVEGRHPLEVIRNAEIDEAIAATGEQDALVVRELAHVGEADRTLLLHAARFPRSGARAGTVAVFHDVSEIRRLEQVRSDFIANASHELRTPLTAIQGFADTLVASGIADERARLPLEAIVRNARRLGELIDDLLELSRIESRGVPMRPTEVDLSRICRQLAEDATPRLRDARIDIHLDLDEASALAWADARAIEQVVSNLLDNAIKYSEPGGRITLRTRVHDARVEVEVGDTGMGIPEEDLGRIFERFYRVDKARSRALGGTGLGLAIVKHLVQAMGGEIAVDSRVGEGTTFRFHVRRAGAP